ncbi:Zn(2+) purple acid phosphatase [Seminavis robusta]|uniref:Purple acid phosphatase n=1 Tax=Seminavis robusta TaxID=568900 RepID=A0A9N8EPQ3_9STRA|nr:Zn(2+) purple acid phosphatase [Seminavis robusta]|eukprot:Sro1353_g265390.1 Zn(2+) purple acid phosphatase (567) ;mRNA; r:17971-19766
MTTRIILSRTLRILLLLWINTLPVVHASRYRARSCAGSIRHVHLAVGHDPATQMTVSFSSVRSFHAPLVGGVLIGTSPDNLDVYIEEKEHRYYNATPDKAKHGEYHSPLLHAIRIKDLEPSTTYYYKCTVRKRHDESPLEASETAWALRGNSLKKRKDHSHDHDYMKANQQQEVMRAEEREESSADNDDEPDQRSRQLDLDYYDGTQGECPPPNKIRTFQTGPALGSLDQTKKTNNQPSLKFAYIGDIGQFEHSQENIVHLVTHERNNLNAIMLAGDIAYTGYDNRRWDTFFDFMDDFFMVDEIPMQICAGNHDIEKEENSNEIFLAYEHRFDMPHVQPAQLGVYDGPSGHLNMDAPPYPLDYEYGNAYYAFSYGITHNIFLNAYSSMDPGSIQYKWLVRELQSVERRVTPWLIVTMHVPVYNAFDVHHHDLQILAAKEHIEPLFVQYKVNLVVAGHIHAYQRTKNVAMDEPTPKGPVHVVVGAGGRQCKAQFQTEEPAPWVAVRDATRYGYGTLEIFNATHAQWDWVVTGHSEYQDENVLWKQTDTTFPPLRHSDSVVLENQFFL